MADLLDELLDNDETRFVSPVQRELEEIQSSQQGFLEDLKTGFESTALAAGIRRAGTEGTAALEDFNARRPQQPENERVGPSGRPGMTLGQMGATLSGVGRGLVGLSYDSGEEFDKEAHQEALLKDIPSNMWGDIMGEPTLAAAQRARARILQDFQRQRLESFQLDGGANRLVGSLLDVDMPLMFASGGMLGASRVARGVRAASGGDRAVGTAQGVVGGTQAGALVGAYDLAVRETADEQTFVTSLLGGTILGGTLGSIGGPMTREVEALNEDYMRRVQQNDPTLAASTDTVDMDTPDLPFEPAAEGAGSIGAAATTDDPLGFRPRTLVDPADRLSPTSQSIIDHADRSNFEDGFYDRKAEDKNWLERLATSSWNTAIGSGFQGRLYESDSAVLNWLGRTVFESASGLNRGKATAAALMENYHKRIQTQLLPSRSAMTDWARRNDATAFGSGYGVSNEGRARFYREVMLERNARRHSRTYSTDPDVIRAADAYDSAARDALEISRGREDQHSVLGMDEVADNPHYTPYNWSGTKIVNLIRNGTVRRENMVRALANSYRKAGMSAGKDADAIAEAVLRRAELKDAEIDGSVHSLLQADGQEFLRDSLERSGMSGPEVDGIMQRLVGAAADRSKEGFAKARNELDMQEEIVTESGPNIQIVDLLSNDLNGDWQRYTRRVAGAAALARQGITSRHGRKEVISAIHAEQRALGEELMPLEELEAMFSHFDGGPVQGWSNLGGGQPAAAGPGIALLKRMVQLAWLNKLGLTQLGETGAMMMQNGMASWMRRGPFALLDQELKRGNKELLDDIAFMTGEIGRDHDLFSDHLNLDEVSDLDAPDIMSRINKHTSQAAYVQGFTSMFNVVRSHQQKTAALGVMDKVMRTLRDAREAGEDLTEQQYARMWGDLGLDRETLQRLENLIGDGTIEFSPEGFVNRLNAGRWDGDLQDIVGASITRNINQVVQKSMAGEQDAWMHTGVGSILSHLKTFPLQATHKQFIRHFRHNDPEAYGAVMATFGTALVASIVRAAVDGDDMTAMDHGKRAFGYSNMTGFIPMAYDPLMTMMGLDDLRFNQYGKHAEIAPPILSFANDAMRLPGALAASAMGTANYDDLRAKRTLPFANTILFGEMMTSIGQAN